MPPNDYPQQVGAATGVVPVDENGNPLPPPPQPTYAHRLQKVLADKPKEKTEDLSKQDGLPAYGNGAGAATVQKSRPESPAADAPTDLGEAFVRGVKNTPGALSRAPGQLARALSGAVTPPEGQSYSARDYLMYPPGMQFLGHPEWASKAVGGVPQKTRTDAAPEHVEPVGAADDGGAGGERQPPSNMPASQWVAAHEMALVDPERQADLQNALAKEAAARVAAGDVAAQGQEIGAEWQMAAAQQQLRDEQQFIDNKRAREEYLDRIAADIESDSKDLANSKIDPERFWHSRTTGQQVFGLLGMAAGGFLSGFKGQRNPAADMIQAAIENDIHAQRADLEGKWESMRMRHSLLADKAQRYGSMDVAERQMVASRLQGAMLMAQAAAARATSPIERLNAQAIAAQLEQKAVEAGVQMNRFVQAGYAGGAGVPGAMTKDIKNSELVPIGGQLVYAGSAEEATAFRKRLMAGDELESNAQEILQLMDKVGPSTIMHGILGDIQAKMKMMAQSDTAEQLSGSARGGLGLMKFISDSYAGASSLNPYARAKAKGALNEFIKHVHAAREGVKQELAGNPVVNRIQDPVKQRFGIQLTGQTFDPGASPQDGGPGPQVKGFRPAGQ